MNNTLDYLCLRGCTGIDNAGWVALADTIANSRFTFGCSRNVKDSGMMTRAAVLEARREANRLAAAQ